MKPLNFEFSKLTLVTLISVAHVFAQISALAAPPKAPSTLAPLQPDILPPKTPVSPRVLNAIEESQRPKDWYVLLAPLFGATLENQSVKQGQWLEGGKILKNASNGPLKLISKSGVLVVLTPGSSVTLEGGPTAGRGDTKTKNSVVEGMVRWIFKPSKDALAQNQTPMGVQTTNAVMGVRGTDFIVVFNGLLNETEVISFDGNVSIANKAALESDKRDIPKGHWGGLGGRFGQNIAPLIKLPSHIVEHFTKAVTFKSIDSLLKSNPAYYGEAVPEGF